MGGLNCSNCQCNKEQSENEELKLPNNENSPNIKENDEIHKIKCEGKVYFGTNITEKKEDLQTKENDTIKNTLDIDTTSKKNHYKDIASNRSDAKMSIDINDDKIASATNIINKNNLINEETKVKEIEEEFNNDLTYSDDEEPNKDNNDINKEQKSEIINHQTNRPLSPIPSSNHHHELILSESQAENLQISKKQGKNQYPPPKIPGKQHEYEVNKIQFGLDSNDNLSQGEQKLFEEAQNNLNQFYAPEKNEENALLKKLSKINLNNIVPSTILKNINSNETIFHGELKKLINYEINAHKTQLYSSRFCTMSVNAFKYYKSKEQFLTKQKPLCAIPLNQITKINFAKIKKNSKKIDHIIICNRLGIKKGKSSILGGLFNGTELSSYISSPETSESLLIFTSEIEESLLKWYVILNYFLNKSKE